MPNWAVCTNAEYSASQVWLRTTVAVCSSRLSPPPLVCCGLQTVLMALSLPPQIVDVQEGFLSLMDDGGDTRDDVHVPEGDVGKEISARFKADEQFMVTVLKAMGEETAIGTKNMTK